MYGINAYFKLQIPSSQSIEFKLSQNCTSSRTQAILQLQHQKSTNNHNQQPLTSLTYTESCTDIDVNSLRQLYCKNYDDRYNEDDKENINQIQFVKKIKPYVIQMKGFTMMKNKKSFINNNKSILCVKNIELPIQNNMKEVQHQSDKIFNLKNSRKNHLFLRKKIFSQDSQNSRISLTKNQSQKTRRIHTQQTMDSSHSLSKRSQSVKTNDNSIMASATRSIQKKLLEQSQTKECFSRIRRIITDRVFSNNLDEKISSTKTIPSSSNLNPNRKKQFLQDTVHLFEAINIKSIKLQENRIQSKLYLRKLIQNRVYTQHYDQRF